MTTEQSGEPEIQHASSGHGPLWQRDYSAQIRGSSLSAEAAITLLRREFPAFSPEELAAFSRNGSTPIAVGEDMKVVIKGYGECAVRCVHFTPHSLTLRTLEGHFEAGRITFGAHEENENLVFHIRSRARTVDRVRHLGYKLFGHKFQEKTWVTFIERVAEKIGGEIIGQVAVETQEAKATLADLGEIDTPTLVVDDASSNSSGQD